MRYLIGFVGLILGCFAIVGIDNVFNLGLFQETGGVQLTEQAPVVSAPGVVTPVVMASVVPQQDVATVPDQQPGTRTPRDGKQRAQDFRTCMRGAGFGSSQYQTTVKPNEPGGFIARVRESVHSDESLRGKANVCAEANEHTLFAAH